MAFLDKAGLEHLWVQIVSKLGKKVDKVEGMGLSTNDYTIDEKVKLAGIAEGATNVTVDSALSSTSTNPVQNKVVNTAISNLNTLIGDTSVSEQISNAMHDVDYAAGNEYYIATFDGTDTLYSNYSCNLYSVTVDNGKIPSDLTDVEPIGISLIVAFENSSDSSSDNYIALRINGSNYYVVGGRNISGTSSLLRAAQPFLNNPCRIEFALDSKYTADSVRRGIWSIPGGYSNYTAGGANFASAVDISKGGTGASTAEDALTNLNAVNKAGDTMTGDLTINKSSVPMIRLVDNMGSNSASFYCNDGITGIGSYDDLVGGYPHRGLYLNSPSHESTLDNALQFSDVSDSGLYKYYRVFHSGMETPIPIANGGTGATTAADARSNLGAAASSHNHSASSITSGTLAIARGGTGAQSASAALTNLGAVAKAGDIMGGKLVANATSVATLGTAQVRNIWAGTADISEVEGSLNEGDIYLQYEE